MEVVRSGLLEEQGIYSSNKIDMHHIEWLFSRAKAASTWLSCVFGLNADLTGGGNLILINTGLLES